MRILNIRAMNGPNLWAYRPVLVMKLDLEDMAEVASDEMDGFVDRLLSIVPGVGTHGCDTGEPGRFAERLRRGTYLAHITEHVTIELTNLAGMGVSFGKARWAGKPGVYNVVVRYKAEQATRFLLRTAVELVESVIANTQASFPLQERLEEAQRIAARTELGPSTRAIADAADKRGIPWRRLNQDSLLQLGYGVYRKHIQAAMTSQSNAIAMEIAGDKELTRHLLSDAFIPVPEGYVVTSYEEALEAWEDLGGPVVIKPLDGRQGLGVSLNLNTPEQVKEAFECAEEHSSQIIVEHFLRGRDYRILTINGKLIAAAERKPAHVVGDGKRTIAELVAIENLNPLRGEGHEKPLSKMHIDAVAEALLRKQGLAPESVPAKGQEVLLRENANLSTGGTARDVTHLVHPETVALCERATRLIGLDICGIDLVTPDITKPVIRGEGGIVELNAAPGLRMHLHPSEGPRHEVGEAIIDMLYPPGSPFRIPVISVTGSNGKTTVTRMISYIMATAGYTVGATTTDAIYIDGQRLATGDMTGPMSARAILADPAVEMAVLETARGGIVRGGLGYDWSDVGVVTNIQADHIGQDGIEDVEDLIRIKALVAERVREGGTLILNADDENAMSVLELDTVRDVDRKVVLFSMCGDNRLVLHHRAAGGTAYYVRDGWIMEGISGLEKKIIQVCNIPATLNGAAKFNVANALAAVAAARAQGIPPGTVFLALARFDINRDNPGRMNLYRVGAGYVMLDYGHNPAAFESVAQMVESWRAEGRRVSAVLGLPGDRADWVTQEATRTAARTFDRLILREDTDLRGREPGELLRLMRESIREVAPDKECVEIADEQRALEQAICTMDDGEVVVAFFDKIAIAQEVLQRNGAAETTAIGQALTVELLPGAPRHAEEAAWVGNHLA
jgi:cyanophycin synthetase